MKRILLLLLLMLPALVILAQESAPVPVFKVTRHKGATLTGEMLASDQEGFLVLRDRNGMTHRIPRSQIRNIVQLPYEVGAEWVPRSGWQWVGTLGYGTNGQYGMRHADFHALYQYPGRSALGVGMSYNFYFNPGLEQLISFMGIWKYHLPFGERSPYLAFRGGTGLVSSYLVNEDGPFWESRDYHPGLMASAAVGYPVAWVGRFPLSLELGYQGQQLRYTRTREPFSGPWLPVTVTEVRQWLQRWVLRMAITF